MLSMRKLDVCLFQKKNKTENVKILLKNTCINNGVTNGLKERKKTCKTALYGKKKKRHRLQVSASKLLGAQSSNIKMPTDFLNKTCKKKA